MNLCLDNAESKSKILLNFCRINVRILNTCALSDDKFFNSFALFV